jgi:beta-glucosidase
MKENPSFRTFLKPAMILVIAWILVTSIPSATAQEWTHQAPAPQPKGPWSDKTLSPDQRADLLIQQMTVD